MTYDDPHDSDWYKEHVAKAERQNREHVARYDRSFNGVMAKAMAADAPDDQVPVSDHHASKVADLLVEAGSFPHRAAALQHLLHKPSGQALLARMNKKDNEPMDRQTKLHEIAKQYGVLKIAKDVVDHADAFGITEPELVEMIGEYDRQPGESTAKCFSRHFERQDDVGLTLRKAVQVAKAWPAPMSLEPMVATGASGFPSTRMRSGSSPGRGDDSGDVDSVGVSDAYAQLTKLAEQQRRAGETASQAFERIYLDPANKHLAEAERSANRPKPTTYFPMPR
jgi:hypothetical protein